MEITMNIPSLYKSLLAVSVLAVGMAGCNTVSGVGKDIAGIGNFIAGGADETQEAVFGPGEDYGSPSTLGQSEAPETQTGMSTDSQTQSSGQASASSTAGTSSSTQMSGSTGMEPASGQSIVYFDSGSASLTSTSREELRAALAQQRLGTQTRIQVTGYADSVGAPEVNERLSQRRAEAVAEELAMLGVPREAVDVAWRGEAQLAVATGDEVPEAENRRVTIQYAPTVAQTY
jgi:outer membrane protein OmpA-like peptidoglycan-associated protein